MPVSPRGAPPSAAHPKSPPPSMAAGLAGHPEPEIEQALGEAAARFRQAGKTWSVYCRRIYEILLRAAGPVRAYAMMEPLKTEGRRIYPPTVYRALAALEEVGLVHRIASLTAFAACTGDGHGHTPAFMICDRCGGAEETQFQLDPDAVVAPGDGFTMQSLVVELHGVCRRCTGAGHA